MTTGNPFEGSGEQNVPQGWETPGEPQAPPPPPPAPVPPVASPQVPPASPVVSPMAGMADDRSLPTVVPGAANSAGVGSPVLETPMDAPVAPEAPKASRAPWILALVGAIVLLGGGGFFALSALGASGGADSPEQAVDELIEALSNEDFVTMAELLEPSERRSVAEPVITEILPELVRIGMFDDSVDAAAVDGVDLEYTDVEYRVDPLAGNPDLVHVFFTGGEFASELNVDALPLGNRFREFLGDDLEDEPRQVESIEADDVPIVFVERDGRWYISMMFTMAENARLQTGEDLPAAVDAPAALGSDSPEAAVEAMFEEVVDLDLDGLIGRMDPEEMAVLYRYAPLFVSDGQQALNELDRELAINGVTWDITNFDLEADVDGDEAVVAIRGMDIEVLTPDVDVTVSYSRELISGELDAGDIGSGSLEITPRSISVVGEIDGETVDVQGSIDTDARTAVLTGQVAGELVNGQVEFDPDGECSTYSFTGPDVNEAGCLEDQGASSDELLLFFDQLGEEFPGASLTTRLVDGEWYVSPITTAVDGTVSWLQGLEDDAFTTMLDDFESVFEDGPSDILDIEDALGGLAGGTLLPQEDVVELPDFDELPNFDELPEIDELDLPQFDDFDGNDLLPDPFEPDDFPEAQIDEFNSIPGAGEYQSTLTSGTFDVYDFELEAGQTLTITMLGAGGLDTFLTVFTPDGQILENDDHTVDLPGAFDSQIVIDSPSPGFYAVEARSFFDEGAGSYTLIIEIS